MSERSHKVGKGRKRRKPKVVKRLNKGRAGSGKGRERSGTIGTSQETGRTMSIMLGNVIRRPPRVGVWKHLDYLWKLDIGNWKLETGLWNWTLDTGSWTVDVDWGPPYPPRTPFVVLRSGYLGVGSGTLGYLGVGWGSPSSPSTPSQAPGPRLQEAPGGPQEAPGGPQEAPRRPPGGPSRPPAGPQEAPFLPKPKGSLREA